MQCKDCINSIYVFDIDTGEPLCINCGEENKTIIGFNDPAPEWCPKNYESNINNT